MKIQLSVIIALLLGPSMLLAAERANYYPCFRTVRSPQVDGAVNGDPAWQAGPRVTGFHVLGGGYAQAKQTTAMMCWDQDAVYVAMVCEEPDAPDLRPEVKDGGWTWGEDSVEIFLQPRAGGQTYQIGVTAGGAKGSGEGQPDIAKCTAAARRDADSYSLELRVPYEVLGTSGPAAGATWRGTFCRNIHTATKSGGDKYTNWSPLEGRFLEPHNFAVIEFLDKAVSETEAVRLTAELNLGYRATLGEQLRTAAARAVEFRDALAQAAQDPRHGVRARELASEWRRLEAVNRQAGDAPATEVRRALLTIGKLIQASYEVKYTYLLDRLVEE